MFYKLREPIRQPGVPGLVFPVEWSDELDPWETVHTGSVIVAGFIDASGNPVIDDTDLEQQLEQMELMIEASRTPIPAPPQVRGRIGKPSQTARAAAKRQAKGK